MIRYFIVDKICFLSKVYITLYMHVVLYGWYEPSKRTLLNSCEYWRMVTLVPYTYRVHQLLMFPVPLQLQLSYWGTSRLSWRKTWTIQWNLPGPTNYADLWYFKSHGLSTWFEPPPPVQSSTCTFSTCKVTLMEETLLNSFGPISLEAPQGADIVNVRIVVLCYL